MIKKKIYNMDYIFWKKIAYNFHKQRYPAVRKRSAVSFIIDRLDYSFSISDLESPVIRQISAGG